MQHFYEMLFLYFTGPWLNFVSKLSQNIDFNLSSVFIHCAILLSFASLTHLALQFYYFLNNHNSLRRRKIVVSLFILCSSLAYLWHSAASQNSLTPYLAPSYYRVSLKKKLKAESIQVPLSFIKWRDDYAITKFKQQFDWNEYLNLSAKAIIKDANAQISEISKSFGYAIGPTITKVKTLNGIPRILGYSYGGPAYYDSNTHEIVLPKPEDYPASRYFFISTVYHEISHALVFQNEIDASLIQYLAMRSSRFNTVRALAEFMWLEYTKTIGFNAFLDKLKDKKINRQFLNEIHTSRVQVTSRMAKLPVVSSIKNIMRSLNLFNDYKKYGINPLQFYNSTFYQVIYQLESDSWLRQSNRMIE